MFFAEKSAGFNPNNFAVGGCTLIDSLESTITSIIFARPVKSPALMPLAISFKTLPAAVHLTFSLISLIHRALSAAALSAGVRSELLVEFWFFFAAGMSLSAAVGLISLCAVPLESTTRAGLYSVPLIASAQVILFLSFQLVPVGLS